MPLPVRNPARPLPWTLAWLLLSAAPALAQTAEGMLVTVPNPITSDAVNRIRALVQPRLEDKNRPVATVIFDFNPDGKPAGTVSIGSCMELQTYIQKIQGAAKTVAFVHGPVSGHTVLPVIACQDVVMGKGAMLGPVRADGVDPLGRNHDSIYVDTLDRLNRTGLAAVVRKMYDPNVRLVKGNLNRAGPNQPEQWVTAYLDANDPETKKLVEAKRFVGAGPVNGVPDDQLGTYTAALARELGLARFAAETRAEVAELYGLPPLFDDPLQGRSPEVYQWTLKGDVDKSMQESVNRVIRDVRRKNGNVLILTINCGGNDLTAARQLAEDLMAAQHGEDGLHIVGFIPEAAPSAGTVVAFGCTQIVMTKTKPGDGGEAKEAEIGDFSGFVNARGIKEAEVEAQRQSIRSLAESQQYPPVLIDGMFQKDVEILRVRPKNNQVQNQRRLMTRDEFENARGQWDEDAVIKPKGQLLKLNATRAVELGLARSTVDGTHPRAVCAAFGWPPEPQDPDPGWLDKFADFLRQPVVTVLLVVLGFTGLILELKVPGLTVPGIIAALCFILVFWAQSRFSGQTFVLALLLFMLGLVLVGIEIFVLPGFGACGICGILCMLAGLGLVTLDKIPESGTEWGLLGVKVSQYMFAMMGALALAFFIARFLPKMPYANRLILNAPVESPGGTELLPGAGAAAELLGAIGTASTPLRPAGVVKFADKFVDVVSDGGFIPAGTRVQVIQVEGTRIVVKEV